MDVIDPKSGYASELVRLAAEEGIAKGIYYFEIDGRRVVVQFDMYDTPEKAPVAGYIVLGPGGKKCPTCKGTGRV